MNGMPIIRLELDQMRQTIMHAFNNYNKELSEAVDKQLKTIIENFDYQTTVTECATSLIKEAIKDYFSLYGEGGSVIRKSVGKALDEVLKQK